MNKLPIILNTFRIWYFIQITFMHFVCSIREYLLAYYRVKTDLIHHYCHQPVENLGKKRTMSSKKTLNYKSVEKLWPLAQWPCTYKFCNDYIKNIAGLFYIQILFGYSEHIISFWKTIVRISIFSSWNWIKKTVIKEFLMGVCILLKTEKKSMFLCLFIK